MSTHRIPPSSGVSYTDTPYKAFLHTNFVPSEDECRRIRDLVAHPKKELEETIKEIDHLRTTLGQLTAKRDRLAEFVDSHLALVSETRRLPNDIMGEIFLASLPNYRHISMAPAESPLLLTRICREWRSLALSMPRLWTSLRVIRPVTCQYITFQTTHVDRVQLWLQRSGGATGPPLSISYSPRRPSHQIVDTILQTLMEFSHRWEHVNFDLGYSGPLENLSRDDVPLLRTVIIDGGYWLDNNVVWVPCGDNTRSMSIRGSLQQTTQPVSSTSLVHLSLPSVSLTQALAILRQCFNLQTCTLALGNDPDNFPASEAFRMEFVRRLCVIDDTSTNSSVHLLEYLILPNLQCFESLHRTNSPVKHTLAAFSSPDKLTSLSLSAFVSTGILAECPDRFPMLQTLCLHRRRQSLAHNGVIGYELFQLLTPSLQSPAAAPLCPRLQIIHVFGVDVGSDEELLAMVDSRLDADDVQPLAFLEIVFPRGRQVDITAELIDAGVEATLDYASEAQLRVIQASRPRRVAIQAPRSLGPMHLRRMKSSKEPQAFERDPEDDWGPISDGWGYEYQDWGS